MPHLKIGKIAYSNLFPIFYMLERECDCSGYEFIEGVPSTLNRLLRSGEIDVSPSSSIEYLRYQNMYTLIDGHSLSSRGPVGSILLLSTQPIEKLEGKKILTSSQSDTSITLLSIILKKFYKIQYTMTPTDEPVDSLLTKGEAFLLIGDDALKAQKLVTSYKLKVKSESRMKDYIPRTPNSQLIYIYDLGELWYKNTGLHCVFALWIARKDCSPDKNELLERLICDLDKAKRLATENLDNIAHALRSLLLNRHSLDVTEEELVSYWEGISFNFNEEHKKGLELFRKYSEELGLL